MGSKHGKIDGRKMTAAEVHEEEFEILTDNYKLGNLFVADQNDLQIRDDAQGIFTFQEYSRVYFKHFSSHFGILCTFSYSHNLNL